jgi:hypothetical protein
VFGFVVPILIDERWRHHCRPRPLCRGPKT